MKKAEQVAAHTPAQKVHVISVKQKKGHFSPLSYAIVGFMDQATAVEMFYAFTQLNKLDVEMSVVTIDNVLYPKDHLVLSPTPGLQQLHPGMFSPQMQQPYGMPHMSPRSSMEGNPYYNPVSAKESHEPVRSPSSPVYAEYYEAMRKSNEGRFEHGFNHNNARWINTTPGKLELMGTKFLITYSKEADLKFVTTKEADHQFVATWDGNVFTDSSHSRLQPVIDRVLEHLKDLRIMGLER